MKKVTVLFLICLASVAGLVSFATAAVMPDYIYLFDKNKPDLTNWRDKFEDNAYSHLWLYGIRYRVAAEGKIFGVWTESSSIGIYENQYENYTIVEDED